ncbi:hypothetical protein PANT_9c00350 [Moesziomyces antarcticus T-34]|uniref:Uncharacterized protein n=1 Tax=Pseudozyma antarctica (strain T-34) TaxID=1151754 RepID=M9LVK3_PSEA3|nr:hypothetical protein PANT_9c00350 [Moesziomyces antarcticus T-34]
MAATAGLQFVGRLSIAIVPRHAPPLSSGTSRVLAAAGLAKRAASWASLEIPLASRCHRSVPLCAIPHFGPLLTYAFCTIFPSSSDVGTVSSSLILASILPVISTDTRVHHCTPTGHHFTTSLRAGSSCLDNVSPSETSLFAVHHNTHFDRTWPYPGIYLASRHHSASYRVVWYHATDIDHRRTTRGIACVHLSIPRQSRQEEQKHPAALASAMSAVATRRASLTPSSPASRRGSWVDVPIVSAPSSRRGSRVDLTINTTGSTSLASPEPLSASSQTKLSIHQLLGSLSHVSDSQSRMSSPGNSRSPTTSESHTGKRKFDADADSSSPFPASSAAEIQLPSDPLRRASIINLATAAAAAVLQCQVGRHMSTLPEQDQKRQRVEQLEMLIEQARKASDRTKSMDSNGQAENASHNVAIANALANHLGLTPQPSAPSTPAAATPSPLSAEPVTAERLAADTEEEKESGAAAPVQESRSDKTESKDAQRTTATAPKSATPTIVLNKGHADEPSLLDKLPAEHQREWQSTVSSDKFLDEAKEVATTYSRFYRFEKEWAQKALELERRRSSVRIDPLSRLPPGNAPLSTNAPNSGPTSPTQHSAPESRIMSRGASPFGDFSADSAARTSHSVPSGSFSSSHRGSSSGLANVLSNFAELIEHRQRSCSGLEALAKQAKELPVKRLSQPNPQFRTTFGEFSWSKGSQGGAKAGSQTINEADADSDASSPAQVDGPAGSEQAAAQSIKAEPSPARLQVKSERKIKEEAAEPEADGPATPRSTMSIASML